MRYRLLCVGRRARDPLLDASDRYAERLQRYANLEIVRLKESDTGTERDRILSRLRDDEQVVLLDERGREVNTEQLARMVAGWQRNGVARVALIIGGSEGVHPDVRARAHTQLALSRLTLPHRLALVVTLEQLYRAHTLLRGEPYHRG